MSTQSTETMSRWEKIKHGFLHETKKFLIATSYSTIWFYAIGLYNQSQMLHLGVDGADSMFSITVALIKAAFVGKFLITVELLMPIKVNKGKPIFWSLVGHSLIAMIFYWHVIYLKLLKCSCHFCNFKYFQLIALMDVVVIFER